MYHGGAGLDGSLTPSRSHIYIPGRAAWAGDLAGYGIRGKSEMRISKSETNPKCEIQKLETGLVDAAFRATA